MRYLFSVFFLAAAANAVAMPPPEIPRCNLKLAPSVVHVGTMMRADVEASGGGYITGATIAGKPVKIFDSSSTWVASKEGTFTVEGTISGPAGTGRCTAEYTVLAGNDSNPQTVFELLEWPKFDLIYCRVKYYGSADRKAGAVFDVSMPMGAERYVDSVENKSYVQAAKANSVIVLGESGLRLQLSVQYEVMACRSSEHAADEPGPVDTYQSLGIFPLLYRGDTLLAPEQPVVSRRSKNQGKEFPGLMFNCSGDEYSGFEKSFKGRLSIPREPQYFETTTGNGVLQIKCSSMPDVLHAPFPPVFPTGGPVIP